MNEFVPGDYLGPLRSAAAFFAGQGPFKITDSEIDFVNNVSFSELSAAMDLSFLDEPVALPAGPMMAGAVPSTSVTRSGWESRWESETASDLLPAQQLPSLNDYADFINPAIRPIPEDLPYLEGAIVGSPPPAHPSAAYKTVMCEAWLTASICMFGYGCKFAHGLSELRSPPTPNHLPKYKTSVCTRYTVQGICPHGASCLFIHPVPTENFLTFREASEWPPLIDQDEPLRMANRKNFSVNQSRRPVPNGEETFPAGTAPFNSNHFLPPGRPKMNAPNRRR